MRRVVCFRVWGLETCVWKWMEYVVSEEEDWKSDNANDSRAWGVGDYFDWD